MTSDNLFMSLSFIFCKRGTMLTHGVAVHLHLTKGHGKLRLLKQDEDEAAGAGVAQSALAPAIPDYFPSWGLFICFPLPRILFPNECPPFIMQVSVVSSHPPLLFQKLCFNFSKVLNPSMKWSVYCWFSFPPWNREGTMKVSPACSALRNPTQCCPKQALSQYVLNEWTGNKAIFRIFTGDYFFFFIE